ncbi:hypothetical protein [Bacillus sp. JJ722]|uniref:hypothetical protein n=1 Tax=Bacillus sp. JJ722 TaxID=3122973 RepID=UPI002FFDF1EC
MRAVTYQDKQTINVKKVEIPNFINPQDNIVKITQQLYVVGKIAGMYLLVLKHKMPTTNESFTE